MADYPQDECPDCGRLKVKRAKRCKPCSAKSRIGESRTDTPSDSAGWYRARRARPLPSKCEFPDCDAMGMDRHHIDGDVHNNDLSNLAVYCRRHHMTVDGRLQAAAERAPYIKRPGAWPRGNAA